MYVDAPPNISASTINCKISAQHLTLGIKGATTHFLDESTFSKVEIDSSSWYMSDGVIHIVLAKAHRGLTWESALLGHDGTLVDCILAFKRRICCFSCSDFGMIQHVDYNFDSS